MLYNLSVEHGVGGGRSALYESEAVFHGWGMVLE